MRANIGFVYLLLWLVGPSWSENGAGPLGQGAGEGTDEQHVPPPSSLEISYVLEPFESLPQYADEDTAASQYERAGWNLTEACDDRALFGKCALQIESLERGSPQTSVSFERIVPERGGFHSCHGATHLSLWYNILDPPRDPASTVQIKVTLLDDSNPCGDVNKDTGSNDPCPNAAASGNETHHRLENYVHISTIRPRGVEGYPRGWNEMAIGLPPLNEDSWTWSNEGIVGNGQLDINALRGWRIELIIDQTTMETVNSTLVSNSSLAPVVVALDQLACVGGGELLGSSFFALKHTENATGAATFQQAGDRAGWTQQYYQSNSSEALSSVSMGNGMLDVEYTVEQVEVWGGFMALEYQAPLPAYYNLSNAAALSLDYDIVDRSSVPNRLNFRVILFDASHSGSTSRTEHYYSFHPILDDEGQGEVTVELEGSSDSSSPFWRTGWDGIVGNDVLDKPYVKGYRFEVNLDSQGSLGSTVSGAIAFGNLSAVPMVMTPQDVEPQQCTSEANLRFFKESSVFRRNEFYGGACCETCATDPDCLYALSDTKDCFMASYLDENATGLVNTEHMQATHSFFWHDDAKKRGDFCDRCDCRPEDRVIDCRGRDLAIVPKTFLGESTSMTERASLLEWTPRVLDLRNNPRLFVLGTGALNSIAESLEELRLPMGLRHLSLGSIQGLPKLTALHFQDDNDSQGRGTSMSTVLDNAIVSPSGFFGDVCCGLGSRLAFSSPENGLTFCDMKADKPGIDAVYEDFIQYIGFSAPLQILKPTSPFLSEAAESPEKCAEFCAIQSKCKYFSYDGRWKESQQKCFLHSDSGMSPVENCCDPDDYGDIEQTMPGWVSGRPPRTRQEVDNAVVVVSPKNLAMNAENGYKVQFNISLGATPLRGAVWVVPEVATTGTNLKVSISPNRVALYDASTTASVTVHALDGDVVSDTTIALVNNIQSCDAAYTSGESTSAARNIVYIDVEAPTARDRSRLLLSILVPVLALLLVGASVSLFIARRKRQADTLWHVQPAELHFPDPPEEIGRGTFGRVLLAEYRGTQVAVKRVIPPQTATPVVWKNRSKIVSPLKRSVLSTAASSTKSTKGDVTCETSEEQGTAGRMSVGFKSGTYKWRIGQNRSGNSMRSRLHADFITEMRQLSKLRHPCITTVMGAVVGKNVEPMLVMEYMDHGSLHDILHNETMVITGELVLPVLRDIVRGMRFLHAANPRIVHGDLKSHNVLVDSKFRAKVADFGLSQKRQVGATGTPFWMAPELLRGGRDNTPSSDAYSFGIMLYEVYSRRDPYEGEDYTSVIQQVVDPRINKRPPPPASCPPPVCAVMGRCLDFDPEKRPTFEMLDHWFKCLDVDTVEPGKMHFSKQIAKDRQLSETPVKPLLGAFPTRVAEALNQGRIVEPESRDMVTILCSNIVGFTELSNLLPPSKISDMLDRLYGRLDSLLHQHDVFKIQTIDDSYMVVTNLEQDQPDHVRRMVHFALSAVQAARGTPLDVEDPEKGTVKIRVGIHSGPVVASVVGSRDPRYCLFGNTVNTASWMESISEESGILCTERTAQLLRGQEPGIPILPGRQIKLGGKGEVATYWIDRTPSSSISEAPCLRSVEFGAATSVTHFNEGCVQLDIDEEDPPSSITDPLSVVDTSMPQDPMTGSFVVLSAEERQGCIPGRSVAGSLSACKAETAIVQTLDI